jgi:hypothetical protein
MKAVTVEEVVRAVAEKVTSARLGRAACRPAAPGNYCEFRSDDSEGA